MKYVIAIVVILLASFFIGFVFGAVASDEDSEMLEQEDRDQIEFLQNWGKKRRRS